MPSAVPAHLRIGIVGGGPGGLGAAIFLSRLENVSVVVYEQATELREVGAGIHLHANTWRMLEKAGARDAIERLGSSGTTSQHPRVQHRNGLTDRVIKETDYQHVQHKDKPVRTERTTLQRALLEQVGPDVVRLRKKLVNYKVEEGGTVLHFSDGTREVVDLLIGADGIRSAVRRVAFPTHQLTYTGQTAFRTLLPFDLVKDLPGLPDATVFFHGTTSHVFTTQVGNGKFEISARAFIPFDGQVTWGVPIEKESFLQYFEDFHPTVRDILNAAPSEGWKQFAMFSGPELDSLTFGESVVLIGDASHPLAGAFGAGAGFALEDAYILSLALREARSRDQPISYALDLFNQVRLPHYSAMYATLSGSGALRKSIPEGLSSEERIERTVTGGFPSSEWIYGYDADAEWEKVLSRVDWDE